MAVGDLFKYAKRVLFPRPTTEQQLLRLVKNHRITSVVELGIDSVELTATLLTALAKQAGERITYTAIDRFDDRPSDAETLLLVATYRRLIATGAKVRLTPGDFGPTLAAEANSLGGTDLLLFSRGATDEAIDRGWFFLPRMLHQSTMVVERLAPLDDESPSWRVRPTDEVIGRGSARPLRRAA